MKKREISKITTIIFDVGGVQFFYDHMIAAKSIAKLVDRPAKQVYKILSDSGQRPGFTRFCEKGVTEKEYWNYFLNKLNINKITSKKLQKIWNKIFTPNKKILTLLSKFKKNYKLGIISNMGVGHKKFLFSKGITKSFKTAVFSCDVKIRKPNPKIYKIALKKLKSKPNETLFIDDLLRNVAAAKKIKMQGIVYKNHNKFLKELKKAGVKI